MHPASPSTSSPEDVANQILDIVLHAPASGVTSLDSRTRKIAKPSESVPIHTTGWYSAIAPFILSGMKKAIESGFTLGKAMDEAVKCARAAAEVFVREHPIWAGVIVTIIALGALYLLLPWVIEALGFAELGPVAGSWAAAWQSSIGNVEAGSFFAFLQRLGMAGIKVVGAKL